MNFEGCNFGTMSLKTEKSHNVAELTTLQNKSILKVNVIQFNF